MSEQKETIQYTDFIKAEMRVGQITSAEAVPKSTKLVKLEVYFGEAGTRTIVAGIGEHFEAALLVGVQVCAVLNLPPRKMMGIESNGMILAAHTETGLSLVQCLGAPPGAELG
jgi:methionyl-tRNA synthetase